ncbi:MAG: Smr/MutS family protein [Desulfarculus sp.]|nr:Smr/MutS family protein [Desulfarculus sp.]
MAKKKKSPPPKPAAPKQTPFHAPFAGLKGALTQAAPPAPPPQPAPPPEPEPEPGEEDLFAQAMAAVRPLACKPVLEPQPEAPRPRLVQAPSEDLEVLAQLADLVSGGGEFDLRFSDEYVRGARPGVGPELCERLARGEFPVQDYLDLHGLGHDEALAAVEDFLVQSIAKGLRHVLIVHGRGAGSPNGVPVLKNALAQRLTHKRLQKRVLAFCTARAVDGGVGAMYVLLRKWRGPGAPGWA